MQESYDLLQMESLERSRDLVRLESECKSHDWHFDFCDDAKEYRRLFAKHRRLMELARSLGDEGMAIVESFRK